MTDEQKPEDIDGELVNENEDTHKEIPEEIDDGLVNDGEEDQPKKRHEECDDKVEKKHEEADKPEEDNAANDTKKQSPEEIDDGLVNDGEEDQPKKRHEECDDKVEKKHEEADKPEEDNAANDTKKQSDFCFKEIKGDLFSCSKTVSLAHCISADLRMGKGIAVIFKQKFMGIPDLKRQKKGPGEVAILKRDGRFIYYLITKIKYNEKPTYETLKKCVTEMRQHCLAQEVRTLCMPRIGCGLDGLAWHRVEALLRDIFKETPIHVMIYTL